MYLNEYHFSKSNNLKFRILRSGIYVVNSIQADHVESKYDVSLLT